jgi:signal transduction histidine kinase
MRRAGKEWNRDDADPLRPRLMMYTAMAGIVATAAVLLFPSVRFAYHSPPFHVALETAAGLTAALTAFLFFGRLKHNRLQANWALVYALGLSAAVNLFLAVGPAMLDSAASDRFATWAALGGRVIAATSFAFAALAKPEWLTKGRHVGYSVVTGVAVTIGLISLVTLWMLPLMPDAILEQRAGLGAPLLLPHPALVVVQLLSMMLFATAGLGFIRRSERTGDQLMRWLAAGALLAAFSRLHYVVFPSMYGDWVYSGDLLRVGFYALLLVGAVGEIRRYWAGLAQAAAVEERRRIARDLHDGLAQELAYLARETRWLTNHGGDAGQLRSLTAAADRALDESRRAIAALTRGAEEPLDVALAQAAEEVGDRVGATVRLELEPVPLISADKKEALLRIAREAIANAGRHSNADEVVVNLSMNGRLRLRISDEGDGFSPDDVGADRFGLVSMRERAEALDAEFVVTSSPGRGTSVEVALP